jgi:type I restriction enzyme S subunit
MAYSLELFVSVLEKNIDNRGKTPPLSPTGYPLIEVKHIQEDRLYPVFEDIKYVNQDTWDTWFRAHLEPGDILFSTVGSIARSCMVPEEPKFCIAQNILGFRVNRAKSDPRFLYYAINDAFFQQEVHGRTIETVQKSIKVQDLKTCRIPLPPLAEQKAIAAVLGALDDKIELNRRMNATLEAMARTLFQSWFVDFDPVRAKRNGQMPVGMDAATAALFPDAFVDSPLGMIPQGWRVHPVGNIVECVGGSTPSTSEPKYWEGGTHHWTTPKDFSSLQAPVLLDTDRKITEAGISKISSGLLSAGTLLLSSRAPIGYLAIADMPIAINQGFIGLKCNDIASNYFMLNWCKSNMAEIESRATGTTFAEISKQNFRPIPVVLPSNCIMVAFTSKVAQLYEQITANLKQSRTLATLRDTLLPKLLSGELRVSDVASIEGIEP